MKECYEKLLITKVKVFAFRCCLAAVAEKHFHNILYSTFISQKKAVNVMFKRWKSWEYFV